MQEYELYLKAIGGKGMDVFGPPLRTKDPRPGSKSCLEKTIRDRNNEISSQTVVVQL